MRPRATLVIKAGREGSLNKRLGLSAAAAAPAITGRGGQVHEQHAGVRRGAEAGMPTGQRWLMRAGDKKSGCLSFAVARPSS